MVCDVNMDLMRLRLSIVAMCASVWRICVCEGVENMCVLSVWRVYVCVEVWRVCVCVSVCERYSVCKCVFAAGGCV